MRLPSLDDVEFLIGIVNERLNTDEPVVLPPPEKLGRLKACLEQPFGSFAGKDHYPTLDERAAMLFYLIIKNHPLPNGNKRVAVVTTTFFLVVNDRVPLWSPWDMYTVAARTADTNAADKVRVVRDLTDWVRSNSRAATEDDLNDMPGAA